MSDDLRLTPNLSPQFRYGLLVVLLLPVLLAPGLNITPRVFASLLPLGLTGTYRVTTIRGAFLETVFRICHIPISRQRCRLAAVVSIGTYYGGQTGVWTFVLFGPIQYLFGWIFDALIPALGGPLELSIETAKGREFTVWQGVSQVHFERNLELLRNQTSAPIRPR